MKVKKLATVYLIDFMIHNNFRPTICKAEIYRIIEQLYFYSSIESVSLIRLCYIYFPFKHNYNIFNKYILAIFFFTLFSIAKDLWQLWPLEEHWRRQWHPTPVLLPGKSHGWKSLEGCSPWGCWGSDTTERLHFHFSLSWIGEGNGNPLQCSWLENPRDGGAWWAAVYGVTQSWTRLKWLSSSSSIANYRAYNKLGIQSWETISW